MTCPAQCADCRPDASKYPMHLCKVHGCAKGCGGVRMGDGEMCGGEDGEVCSPGAMTVIAKVRPPVISSVEISFHGKSRLKAEGNGKEHPLTAYKRVKAQKKAVGRVLGLIKPPALPVVITMTLISPNMFDKGDNDRSALKHVRDAVAKWLGCGDGEKDPVTWNYNPQERCPRGQQSARVEWSGA